MARSAPLLLTGPSVTLEHPRCSLAFVRSLEHTPSLQSSTSATTWFYRVLRNAMTDYFRRKDSRGRALDRLAAETDEVDPSDSELDAVICGCVLSMLDTLKPEYAAAIRRVDLDGYERPRLRRGGRHHSKQRWGATGTCVTHGCLNCQCGN